MKKLKIWGVVLVLAALLMRPETAVSGAQAAMRTWVSAVAPALFPFLALMPVITGPDACAAYGRLFSRVMGPAFRLPGSAAPAVIVGMIAGSPGGALAVRRIAGQSGMRRSQAARIALSVGGVSPAYLVMGVGYGLYGSARLGVQLAAIQAAVQLVMLRLSGMFCSGLQGISPPADEGAFASPVRTAVENILAVCGYMVLFASISAVAADLAGMHAGTALLLAADLPSGLAALAQMDLPGKLILQGAAIGFAGLCIGFQNLDVLRPLGVDAKRYFAARGCSAGLYAVISALVMRAHAANAVIKLGQPGKVYACALLLASAAAVPALVFLTKKFFLNNRE